MKPKKHIRKFHDALHKMNMDGHIDTPNKYSAMKDIEICLYELQKAFEYSGEIKFERKKDE